MATFPSPASRMFAPVAAGGVAGVRVTEIFNYTVPTPAPGASDIIEIGYLPAHNRIVGAELMGAGTGAATVTVGLLTGAMGDNGDTTRTFVAGTRLFAAATAVSATGAAATLAAALAQGQSDRDVGIGVQPSAALTAGGTLTLALTYIA